MNKQLQFDRRYLEMAQVWAKNSYAIRRKVGALVVKDNMIISDGYNGTPSGFPNVCEDLVLTSSPDMSWKYSNIETLRADMEKYDRLGQEYNLVTVPEVLHAEANAITKLAKSGNSSEGATLYVTCEPCIHCSKLIIQAGIRRVVYSEEYRTHEGVELLKRAGIEVDYIKYEQKPTIEE